MSTAVATPKAAGRRSGRKAAGTAAVEGLPPMENIIGYKLRRAQLLVFQEFVESFSSLKLRPAEFSVLSLIAQEPGLTQSAVAEALGINRANFVALMDAIENRGLAERRKADADRRSHSLHLTPAGLRFVRKMAARWQAHENRLIARLGGAAERDRLIGLLDRLLQDPGAATGAPASPAEISATRSPDRT